MNLRNCRVKEAGQKTAYYVIRFFEMSIKRKFIGTESKLVAA